MKFFTPKIAAALGIFVIVLAAVSVVFYQRLVPPKKIHYHAGFHVYVDGKLVDFSDWKYMHAQPCTTSGASTEKEDEQIEKAHLHDQVGDVVHVHREHATWGDLFKNINYHLDSSKGIEAYVNGKKVDNILSQEIHPYDSAVILVGKHGPVQNYLKQAVTKAHIQKVEQKSETCGS